MKEILITSSALILALLLLRRVFRGTLSRRWQYALWALVLARLLIPVSFLPAANFSVLPATAPVQQAVPRQVARPYYFRPVGEVSPEELSERNISLSQVPTAEDGAASILMEPPAPGSGVSFRQKGYLVRDPETNTVTLYERMTVGLGEILTLIWKIGMVVMGAFFLISNLLFYAKLRKSRQPFAAQSPRRVYLVPEGAVPSPCLFGRSIYITPAVAADENKLRHVLAHEGTHAKHWDPLWSLLRCVCLTVYWFDPLVWIAASCSKTDCELSCDESVLRKLGEDERIGYGETLLSLIPVRRGPANPMLAATTMTAGKRELRDRITRIAQRPRQVLAAVVAVAILAAIAAACTFTGGKTSPTPAPSESGGPTADTLRSLDAAELRWFNEEFFNSSGADQTGEGGMVYNLRNQFANPMNLYDRPEDIDLSALFYCDGEAVPDDELSIVWDGSKEDIPCGAYKLSADGINSILKWYTGLTLSEANKDSLTYYTYSPEHNAYYWMHGDTNYPGDLEFLVGTRSGDTVKLYHGNDGNGHGYCVTLTDKGDGQYWFVSNQESEVPAIPTPLPAGGANAAIPLDWLQPVAPVAAELRNIPGGNTGNYQNWFEHYTTGEDTVWVYRPTDAEQTVYAALERENGSLDLFLTIPNPNCETLHLSALGQGHILGIGYYPESGSLSWPTWDFYIFQDHMPILLCRADGSVGVQPKTLDLDGDGVDELITQEELFFLRDGLVYRADVKELVMDACPEIEDWHYVNVDKYSKSLTVYGSDEKYRDIVRHLYFDGEKLLVYTDEKPTTDHMVDGVDFGVPAAVVEWARAYAQEQFNAGEEGHLLRDEEFVKAPVVFDDWRVESFRGPYQTIVGELTVEAWSFNYELHTTTPDTVSMAGGRYITEDNWVSPGYPGCDYLLFLRNEGGSLTYLWHEMMNDMGPGSSYYAEHLQDRLTELGYGKEVGSFSAAAQDADEKLNRLIDLGGGLVNLRLAPANGEPAAYAVHADRANAPYYQRYFTDAAQYNWRYCDSFPGYPEGASLTIADPSWEYYIQLWEGSDYVMIKPNDTGATWYEVTQNGFSAVYTTDIFSFMRQWFDEAELDALQSGISIPDRGQGPLEIAGEWVAAYEGAYLKLTLGNHLRCTFMKPGGVGTLEDMPEAWFPKDITQYPHFAFCYDTIFVPEGSDGLHWFMAGNTGEYEGPDPEAPEGALTNFRQGSMYLKDGHWFCAGVGTG